MPVEILVSEPDRVLVVLIASFIGSDAAPVLLAHLAWTLTERPTNLRQRRG
jgi:hypothetical protein